MTTIDWSNIPPEYKWVAMDNSGFWYAYDQEPRMGIVCWFPINESLWSVYENPAPDWTTSLQKRPETDMNEIELKVGDVWENQFENARREIIAIHYGLIVYKYHDVHATYNCDVSSVEAFVESYAHKLVESLEFPAQKKMIKKSQALTHCGGYFENSVQYFDDYQTARNYCGVTFISWPLVVNGVEQWIEVPCE
jgi:hypothetical protein